MKRALISVYDKRNIEKLADTLVTFGWEVISSGGTHKHLLKHGIPCTSIEKVTGNPELFDGRIKTISFVVSAGILFNRASKTHAQEAEKFNIKPIDMVVCNFYPFSETVRKGLINQTPADENEIVEMIDVGGPTIVRAAAKNFESVTCVVYPEDYEKIAGIINEGKDITLDIRKELAAKAFKYLVDYDTHIKNYLSGNFSEKTPKDVSREKPLRYGENPHQKGFLYEAHTNDPLKITNFSKHNGKELSFNNYLDIDAALNTLCLVGREKPAAVIVKHTNPCGASRGLNISEAFLKAWEGDAIAAFGGVVAVNGRVDEALARIMISGGRFFEVLLAPEFTEDAVSLFSAKKNLMLLSNPALYKPFAAKGIDIKTVRGGYLMQNIDFPELEKENLTVVTGKKPSDEEIDDLLFAWRICAMAKSNAVTIVKEKQLLGLGAGQQDRVGACKIAREKAGPRAQGAVAASDAFFPFPDGPEVLINAGVAAIIQPGGSVRDKETIDLCDQKGVSMVFTGIRGFRH